MILRVGNLTSGRVLTRSALWNFAGMAFPVLVALILIPLLIKGMGNDRFGLLTIIWMGVGYFSLFDFGLGRSLTKLISDQLGKDDDSDLRSLIWTAINLLIFLGVLGALLLIFLSEPIVLRLLQVPESLSKEAVDAFRILGIGIPIVVLTTALIGILEAYQRFKTIAKIRIPLGVFTFAGPMFTLQFSPSIAWATVALLLWRIIAMIIYYRAARNICEELADPMFLSRNKIRPLLSFGGWLTITNVISPLMNYMDRFFIGSILGLTAVAYYVTPYEMLARMQLLPQAIQGVMFPAMSIANVGDKSRMALMFSGLTQILYWTMLPLLTSVFLFAPEILFLWLGEEFRVEATNVVRWLSAGWVINILAQPAFLVLQATGRPDLIAKSHVAEFIPYVGILWWLSSSYGIAGAAATWALRIAADALILNLLVAIQEPRLKKQVIRTTALIFFSVLLYYFLLDVDSLLTRFVFSIIIFIIAVCVLFPAIFQGISFIGKSKS